MASPYKKIKSANQTWVGYTNISKLDQHMAYKILNIVETNHAEYGPGQQATIEAFDGRKWRTQLPGKYLAQLTKEDLELIKKDVIAGKNVFLIYREKMLDNSYRIDITENNELVENWKKHLEVPELEVSCDSLDTSSTDNAKDKLDNATEDKSSGAATEDKSSGAATEGKSSGAATEDKLSGAATEEKPSGAKDGVSDDGDHGDKKSTP